MTARILLGTIEAVIGEGALTFRDGMALTIRTMLVFGFLVPTLWATYAKIDSKKKQERKQ